jgi:hypothetical protein
MRQRAALLIRGYGRVLVLVLVLVLPQRGASSWRLPPRR